MNQLARAISISRKDIESYYAKPPLVTWGLLFPAVLILAVYMKDQEGCLSVAPGIIGMTLLFGATSMAAIVITFEKRSGTLERLLLAPVRCSTIVLGKAVSAAMYGTATSLVLTAGLAVFLGMPIARPAVFAAGLVLGAGIFALLGLSVSVMVREVFEAMTLLNFFRFPLLFISCVFMPLAVMPGWLKPLAMISPLTYVVELLRLGLFGESYFSAAWIPAAAAVVLLIVSWALANVLFHRNAYR